MPALRASTASWIACEKWRTDLGSEWESMASVTKVPKDSSNHTGPTMSCWITTHENFPTELGD